MTRAEALRKARELFGPGATVDMDEPHFYPRLRYVCPGGERDSQRDGRGRSWEAALNLAEHYYLVRMGLRSR